MRLARITTLSVVAGLTAATVTSSGAMADSTDVGSTAATADDVGFCQVGPSAGLTFFQDAAATSPGYTTPAGVVTSWSFMAGNATFTPPGRVALQIAREGPDNTYTITGASDAHTAVPARLNSYLTRIPVDAGEVIALREPPQSTGAEACWTTSADAGDVVRYQSLPGDSGDSVGAVVVTGTSASHARLDLSARVEPDADGDGYGDLTQDRCPTLRNSHDDCTPPDTFLKSGPPRKLSIAGKTVKAKVTFFASEPVATFTCTLDKGPAKPCKGKFKVKLKTGKHTVTVTAIDAVGNVDPTPLVVKVKVLPKH